MIWISLFNRFQVITSYFLMKKLAVKSLSNVK